jgi:lipopolysaccharide biosynthesis glycosyltransferase
MSKRHMSVWIGFDPREASAYAVARESIRSFNQHLPINGVVLEDLKAQGLYYRITERRLGRLWDRISEAPMSTEFAISRFLVPTLVKRQAKEWHDGGWALFMDCDVLVRDNLTKLRELLDDTKAVCCVKHNHRPKGTEKMDGQAQTSYPRKNWSSVIAFNVNHPANKVLDVEMANTMAGRDLHRLCWLNDEDIGELPPEWNYLVGDTILPEGTTPKIVHFTEGGPWLEAFKDVPFANEWERYLERWAA